MYRIIGGKNKTSVGKLVNIDRVIKLNNKPFAIVNSADIKNQGKWTLLIEYKNLYPMENNFCEDVNIDKEFFEIVRN